MDTWAVVNDETDEIVNAVLWDGIKPWEPPPGHSVYRADPVYIGRLWANGEQVEPTPPVGE